VPIQVFTSLNILSYHITGKDNRLNLLLSVQVNQLVVCQIDINVTIDSACWTFLFGHALTLTIEPRHRLDILPDAGGVVNILNSSLIPATHYPFLTSRLIFVYQPAIEPRLFTNRSRFVTAIQGG